MLEPLLDAWDEEISVDIKMQLLTAAVKLFFKRPPEMQVGRKAIRTGVDVGRGDIDGCTEGTGAL